MTETELCSSQILFRDLFQNFLQVHANTSVEFDNSFVPAGGNSGGFEKFFTEFGFGDTESELLFLA